MSTYTNVHIWHQQTIHTLVGKNEDIFLENPIEIIDVYVIKLGTLNGDWKIRLQILGTNYLF